MLNQKLKISQKPLYEGRWECRLSSIKDIGFQFDNIYVASENLHDICDDPITVMGCESIFNDVTTPEFMLSLIIWYEVLCRVHGIVELCQKLILI
jgi:hypothetical protein